jgi:hypothetical protein
MVRLSVPLATLAPRSNAVTDRRHDTQRFEPPRDHQPTPQPVAIDGATAERIAGQVSRAGVAEHQLACIGPGGPIHALTEKLGGLVSILDKQTGEKRVWEILRLSALPICCVLLAWYLSRGADKRADETIRKTGAVAAEVAKQLKALDDTRRIEQDLMAYKKELTAMPAVSK